MVNQLNSQLGSTVFIAANANEMHLNFVTNPQAYGFVTSKIACCGQGPYNGIGIGLCTPTSNLCPNRDLYAFWDPFHPREVGLCLLLDLIFINGDSQSNFKTPPIEKPSSKVRVVVKVRPFLPSETFANSTTPFSCVSSFGSEHAHTNEVVVHLKDQFTSRKECYKLDSFFGEDNSVSEIFQKEVTPLISWIFHGSNATVFACGATGSGKTHLMQGSDELPGLIPLSMSRVLNMCEMSGSTAEISYYEVYMDKCYDLLDPKEREISVLDDKDGQVHLRGLSRVPVSSMSEFQQVLTLGMERRKVAHTGLNDVSSRSHGVLVISVSSPSCDVSGTVVGKLNLIDLAGNEDNGRTGNDGIRLQESAKINRSLFALSNVIYALNNNKPRVPYRESKLTRILQDSLGGNSHSLMVACLNPGEYHESVNTVSLASRSRQITNYISSAQRTETPSVKIDMEAKLNAWLESKGKTKSAKRVIAFASPLPSKTPLSTTRSIKKRSACPSSIRFQGSTDKGLANARRNLFKSGAPVDSSAKISLRESCGSVASKSYPEPTAYRDVEESKNCFSVTQADGITVFNDESCGNRVTSPLKDVEDSNKDCFSVAQVDDTMVSNDEIYENIVTSPLKDHLIDVEESKDCFSVTQVDDTMVSNDEICENIVTSPLKDHLIDVEESKDCSCVTRVDDTTVSNDESCENRVTSLLREHLIISGADAKDCKEDVAATDAASMPEVKVTSPAELLKNVKSSTCIPSNNSVGSPAFSGKKIRALQDSLRKVLSPIDNNSNIRSYGDLATKSPMCMVVPFDPKTPKTPNAPTCNRDEFQGTKTPLDKYNIRSSNLKSTLVQEYVEFLNSASKEELVKLKGIGQKRADHILHLRETTPLKSLSDLEMIGLSSKQVKGLFRRAARGIFE